MDNLNVDTRTSIMLLTFRVIKFNLKLKSAKNQDLTYFRIKVLNIENNSRRKRDGCR